MSAAAQALILLGVGVLAGIVSTVASLASVVSYPALLALGLPPVSANVTNTALMFTAVGAAVYHAWSWLGRAAGPQTRPADGSGRRGRSRPAAADPGSRFRVRRTGPDRRRITSAILRRPIAPEPDAADASGAGADGGWLSRAGVFAVAVYIGYFGAAGGILMLALLTRIFAAHPGCTPSP